MKLLRLLFPFDFITLLIEKISPILFGTTVPGVVANFGFAFLLGAGH